METIAALLAICAGNSPVTGEFPAQRPVMRSFDVFFDLCLNKQFKFLLNIPWCSMVALRSIYHNTLRSQTFSQSPCTTLVAGIWLSVRPDCQWRLKPVDIFTNRVNSQCIATRCNPHLSLDQPIIKGWCQSIGGHVLYPTDSATANGLGPCSSLVHSRPLQLDADAPEGKIIIENIWGLLYLIIYSKSWSFDG